MFCTEIRNEIYYYFYYYAMNTEFGIPVNISLVQRPSLEIQCSSSASETYKPESLSGNIPNSPAPKYLANFPLCKNSTFIPHH